MTSHNRRDSDSLVFTPKTPHFFKIILEDTIRDGKLRIPRRFVRNYGNGLPNPLLLKVPSGAVWQVELKKCDGDVWLQNGWQEFAEYYSLARGHFLVFRYEENSHFSVIIFDMSTSEIEYPYTVTHGEEYSDSDGEWQEPDILPSPKRRENSTLPCPRPHKLMRTNSQCSTQELGGEVPKIEENENDIFVETLDDISPCLKAMEKTSSPHVQSHKKRATNPSGKIERISKTQTLAPPCCPQGIQSKGLKLKKSKRNINLHNSTRQFGAKEEGGGGMSTVQKCPNSKVLGRMSSLTPKEKARALQRASAFKSENPFFVVAMQPSYIQTGYNLNIPFKFAKRYFNEKHLEVILRVSDGRTWAVKYYVGAYNDRRKACFNYKWGVFAQENNLEVGDVCIFQLIKGIENSLNVVIVPADEDLNCSLSQGNLKQLIHEESAGRQCTQRSSRLRVPGSLEAASKFISKHPFYKVDLRPGHLEHRNLHVPLKFIEKLIKKIGEQNATLQVGDRSWPAKLISYPHYGFGKLSSGWSTFARENSLHVGDVCIFELIRRDDIVLKVSIFRCAG